MLNMAVVKDEMKDSSEAEEPADTEKEQTKIPNESLENEEGGSESMKTARTEEGKNDMKNKEETTDKEQDDKQENIDGSVADLDDIDEDIDIDENGDDEEVEDEEEEEDMEMPDEDKAALVEAVRTGNYLQLQDLWDKPTTDINMTWFNENLLMVAIRAGNEEMAEFLIDNGVDHNFECVVFDLKENVKEKIVLGKRVDCYKRSCRQVAFDCDMDKIVEMIDIKNSNWFPFVKPIARKPKFRRPPAPPIPEKWQPVEEEEEEEEEEEPTEDSNVSNKNEVVIKTDDDLDSGHQSMKDGELSMYSDVYKRGDLYDEGYRTVSNSPYLSPPKGEKQPIFITKPTKSSMLLFSHTSEIRQRRGNSKSAPEKRRLDVVGSYSRESRMWHLPRRKGGSASVASASSTCTRVQSSVITHGSAPAVLKTDPYRQRNMNLLNKRQTPLSQISKILGESRLLSSQSELGLPHIRSTHNVCQKDKSTRVMYGNSSIALRVKDAQFQNRVTHPKFMVNSAVLDRNSMKHGQIN